MQTDLLQQFADRLDSAFDASGVDAIEGSAGALAELAASPVIPAAVATELAILERDGNTSAAQWNGAELVLAARSRWLLAVSFYRNRIESTVTSVPNVGLVSLLSGEAEMTLFDLPRGFDPDRFDRQARLGSASSHALGEAPLLVDGRRHAVRMKVARPSVVLRLFSSHISDFQWRFDAGTGMPLDMSVAQQSDTELESMMQMVAALGTPNATQLLESLCGHRNHTIRWKAIQLLARRDRDAAIERLHHATGDPHPEIRHAATTTLARLEGEPA